MTEITITTAAGETITIRERHDDGLIWSCANCNSPAGSHDPRCPTLRPGERNAPAAAPASPGPLDAAGLAELESAITGELSDPAYVARHTVRAGAHVRYAASSHAEAPILVLSVSDDGKVARLSQGASIWGELVTNLVVTHPAPPLVCDICGAPWTIAHQEC
jgi:hypothetical protein